MGRLKARLSGNPIDSDILKNLAEAEKYLRRALSSVRSNRKNPKVRTARVSELESQIKSALSLINNPPNLIPKHDHDDPDLLTPKQRREKRREQKKNRGNR